MGKQVGGKTTFYLVDDRNPSGYAQVMEEYQLNGSGGGVLSRAYNYGLNLISQQQFNTNTLLPGVLSYYGYDGHGNVRFLMGTNGTITDTYTYDAFGNIIASSGSTLNNYLYCEQQFDPDLGLYYNRARYLNSDAGRFWTSDSTDGDQWRIRFHCTNTSMGPIIPSTWWIRVATLRCRRIWAMMLRRRLTMNILRRKLSRRESCLAIKLLITSRWDYRLSVNLKYLQSKQ